MVNWVEVNQIRPIVVVKQRWTAHVLRNLPASVQELNKLPTTIVMNEQHRQQRLLLGNPAPPINSMVYDTLVRLRNRGLVKRDSNGVYWKVRQKEKGGKQ
jgi:hypothetical protein